MFIISLNLAWFKIFVLRPILDACNMLRSDFNCQAVSGKSDDFIATLPSLSEMFLNGLIISPHLTIDRCDRTRTGTKEDTTKSRGDASLVTVLSLLLNRGNETTAPSMSVSHRSIQTSRYKNHSLSCFVFFLGRSLSSVSSPCLFSRFSLPLFRASLFHVE